MSMYNKLFTKILDSSIWLESMPTRIVWLTFIAVMDESGFVQFASVENVAHRARVAVKDADKAIACLEGPDKNSFDPDHEGRRVERVPGGWVVLNAEKHRKMVTRAIIQEQTRERVKRFRERLKRSSNATLTPSEALAEARSETEKIKSTRAKPASVDVEFEAFWHAYPRKTAKGAALKAWDKLDPDLPLQQLILGALKWQTQQRQWLIEGGKYIPHPATWLNRADYDNEPFHGPVISEHSTKASRTVEAAVRVAKQLESGVELDPFGTKQFARDKALALAAAKGMA